VETVEGIGFPLVMTALDLPPEQNLPLGPRANSEMMKSELGVPQVVDPGHPGSSPRLSVTKELHSSGSKVQTMGGPVQLHEMRLWFFPLWQSQRLLKRGVLRSEAGRLGF
jgi:hypothetical protein